MKEKKEKADKGPFKFVERPTEISLTAYGQTLEQTFANAAAGMFSLMSDSTSVDEHETVEIKLKGSNFEEMLFNFLDELLYRFEVHNFLAKRIDVKRCTKTLLEAVAYGEEKDKTHHIKRALKSVTYHKMKIEQVKEGWRVQVTFQQ